MKIQEDGTYHQYRLDVICDVGRAQRESEESESYRMNFYPLDTAEFREYTTGFIDLKTGEEEISEEDRSMSLFSVSWLANGGKLYCYRNMGNMGGEGFSYRIASSLYEPGD